MALPARTDQPAQARGSTSSRDGGSRPRRSAAPGCSRSSGTATSSGRAPNARLTRPRRAIRPEAVRGRPRRAAPRAPASLADGVLAAEEERGIAADRIAYVLELEPVGVDRGRGRSAPRPLSRRSSITGSPGSATGRRARASLRCRAPRARRDPGRAVPQSKMPRTFTGEPHRPRQHPVGAALTGPGGAEERLRLARETATAYAVAADVHQRPALDVGPQADVVRVVERVAECRAHEPSSPIAPRRRASEPPRLRVVAVHERLREQPPRALRRVERRLDLAGSPRNGFSQSTASLLSPRGSTIDVHRVRQRDVHRLDRRIGEQLLVGAVGLGISHFSRTPWPGAGRGSQRRQLHLRRRMRARDHEPIDVGGRGSPRTGFIPSSPP